MYQYVGNVFKATAPFDRVMGESVSKVGTVNNAIFPILSPYSIFQKNWSSSKTINGIKVLVNDQNLRNGKKRPMEGQYTL